MSTSWIFLHILTILGFILALVLLSHILRERRSPTSTLAWLMAIIFIPYVGVPFYLIFGGRKMIKKADAKPKLLNQPSALGLDTSRSAAYVDEVHDGIFQPTAHNHISFLAEGDQAFKAVIDLIQRAQHSIYISTFIFGKDETGRSILNSLVDRASQGVQVYLLLDSLGSVRISKKFLSPLIHAGGRVAFFMPMIHLPFRGRANLRNHRKIIISDNRSALIGGMNLASEYMGAQTSLERWQDLSLVVEGTAVAHLIEIFKSDWSFASRTPINQDRVAKHRIKSVDGCTAQVVASGPDVRNDSLRNTILTAAFKAVQRIWVVTPYFIPDELLIEALYIAAYRGVDVSIIVPKKSNHRLADFVRAGYLTRIQETGATIWFYEPRMLHAKAIIFDNTLAIVGSANMDMRSLLLNYEVALCIYDAALIGQLESWMLGLVKNSSEQRVQGNKSFNAIRNILRLLSPLL